MMQKLLSRSALGYRLQATGFSRRGITLIEMLVVVAILAILAGIGTLALTSFRSAKTLSADSARVVSMLADARARTLASIDDSQYGVHFATDRSILFKGTSYTDGAATNVTLTLSSNVSISDISLPGGGSDVLFSRLTGKTSQSGSITLSLTGGTSTRVVIEQSGIAYEE